MMDAVCHKKIFLIYALFHMCTCLCLSLHCLCFGVFIIHCSCLCSYIHMFKWLCSNMYEYMWNIYLYIIKHVYEICIESCVDMLDLSCRHYPAAAIHEYESSPQIKLFFRPQQIKLHTFTVLLWHFCSVWCAVCSEEAPNKWFSSAN